MRETYRKPRDRDCVSSRMIRKGNTRRRPHDRSAGGAGMMAASESRLIKSGLCGRDRSTSDLVIGVPLNGLLSGR